MSFGCWLVYYVTVNVYMCTNSNVCGAVHIHKKGSPCSITERRVPELIPVFGSQPAGDVSHKPGCHYFPLGCSYPHILVNRGSVATAI